MTTPFQQARESTGLSRGEAVDMSRTPYRTWQDWELGARRVPGIAWAWLELYAASRTGKPTE